MILCSTPIALAGTAVNIENTIEAENEITDKLDIDPEFVNRLSTTDSENQYCLIHFTGPIYESWKDQVTALGVEMFGYVPEFTFLAKRNGVPEQRIRELPFVSDIKPYLPEYKYSTPSFAQLLTDSGSEIVKVKVVLFGNQFERNGWEKVYAKVFPTIYIAGGEITAFSRNKVPEYIYLNDVATGIMDVEPVRENLSLDGTGQIVTVCDTGLDNGSFSGIHEDFRGRIVNAYARGRPGDWSDDDIHDFTGNGIGGHGTHVAGSVLGGGNKSAGKYKGVAYNASLVIQSTLTTQGNLNVPNDLYNQLFYPPYSNDNSRIHTNSWGTNINPGDYSSHSQDVDEFIWDYPEMVILFAAGNYQITPSNVFSPSTAKNAITVGASESFRPTLPNYGSQCNNIEQRASFSCFGTSDDRIKPDIVAPGTGILSTRTSMVPDPGNHYWVQFNDYYAYAGGTSMATPLTAGVVTLIRQYYTDLEGITPSAALVKATLLNGAVDMDGPGITPPPIPNEEEGWGRINLKNSIFPELPRNLVYIDNTTGLTTDKNFTYTIDVENNSMPFNITLVYSDYPSTTSASFALVNDLHLNVTHLGSGKSYKGNVFNNGWSSSKDSDANPKWDKTIPADAYDNRNNVEGVRIEQPESGRYKITVVGYNIPNGPQPFALALSGGVNPINLLPPSNVQIEPIPTGNALNLSWEPVFGPTIKGYEIFRSQSPTSGFSEIFSTNNTNKKKYLDSNLIDGTTYYYKLRTKNIFDNRSNFSVVVPGTPQDSMPPWVTINKPVAGADINGNVTIKYINDTDCVKIEFKYYIDSNKNGLPDDGNTYVDIGTDSGLNGTFWWNTTLSPGNSPAVIFAAEAYDEVPNTNLKLVKNIIVDNNAPGPPTIDTYSPNPTNQSTITLTGLTEGKASIQIVSNGKEVGANSTNNTGEYNVEVQLFEGMNSITACAIDYLGNGPGTKSAVQQIVVDTVPPVADAGGNFIILEDSWFTFNGTKSYDTNVLPAYNYISSYQWRFKHRNGTSVLLEGSEASYYFDTMGNYTVTLSVRDSTQNLGTQKFWLLVQDDTNPTAIAGENFTWDEDVTLFLFGNKSTDNDPEFNFTGNYTWTFNDYNSSNIKAGKTRSITLFGKQVSYRFNVPAVYDILMTVTDARGNSNSDNITATIRDTEPPVALPSADQLIVTIGRTITLNASKSTDNDPSFPASGNFTWTFKHENEDITLYGLTAKFRFTKINIFTITLLVQDQWKNSASGKLNIIVDPDLHLPTVLWSIPNDNDYNVRVTTVIKIKLSEVLDIQKTPVNLTTFQLLDSQYRLLDGDLRYDPGEALILFIPSKVLDFGESYSLMLLNSLVDLAGNPLDGNSNNIPDDNEDIFKIVFRTSNITTAPDNYEFDVPVKTPISASFSGNISNNTLRLAGFEVFDQQTGEQITGSLEFDFQNYTITFNPSSNLNENRFYIVNLTIYFFLLPTELITSDLLNRELTPVPENLSTVDENYTKTKVYSWTFKTESGADGDGIGIFGEYTTLIIIGIIIVIIILVIVALIFYHRKTTKSEGRFGVADYEYDEEYELEYEKVYGEHPLETGRHKPTGKRKHKHKPKHKPSKAIATARTHARRKSRKRTAREEPDEDDFDFEEEYIDSFDDEEADFEADEEEYEIDEDEDIEGDFEFDLDEDEEIEYIEEDEGEEIDEEIEELDEFEETDEEMEELDELEEMEEFDDVEEVDELEELEELEE
jgi:subtilisin family serine protease